MSVLVKNTTSGWKTVTWLEGKELKKFTFESGRNRISDDLWDKIKDTDFIKKKLKYDQLTISIHKEEEEIVVPVATYDEEYVDGLVGKEDAKQMLAEYAKQFGIDLSIKGNKKIDTLVKDFKEAYAALSEEK